MLSSCSRVWRVSTLRPRPLALAPSRGKKKKSSRKSSAPTDVTPEIASLLDLSKYESSMRKTMEALHSDLSKLRSSGAAPGMLDGIKVEAYGTSTALNNVAQVSVRDGRNLVVNVFDESTSNAVERAIRSAGLNLNPVRDGPAKLRVPVPKQSQKTRETLIKVAFRDAESAKIATRMVRRKAMDAVKGLKDDIGKDDLKRMENSVQQMSERYIDAITSTLDEKMKAISLSSS